MKRGITSRTRLMLALLGAGLVCAACTTVELVNYKLATPLQLAYGRAYDALLYLGRTSQAISLADGNNCRFTGPIADCVDGGVVINRPILLGDAERLSIGTLVLTATMGAKEFPGCANVTYCPPGAAARFRDVVGCKVEACPTAGTIDPGCVINSCTRTLVDDRPALRP